MQDELYPKPQWPFKIHDHTITLILALLSGMDEHVPNVLILGRTHWLYVSFQIFQVQNWECGDIGYYSLPTVGQCHFWILNALLTSSVCVRCIEWVTSWPVCGAAHSMMGPATSKLSEIPMAELILCVKISGSWGWIEYLLTSRKTWCIFSSSVYSPVSAHQRNSLKREFSWRAEHHWINSARLCRIRWPELNRLAIRSWGLGSGSV